MEKNRIRERKREREREEEEMGKGTFGGVSYVLSACVPFYSSYCITGLALLPHSRPFSRARTERLPHHPHPTSTAAAFRSAHLPRMRNRRIPLNSIS